MIKCLIFSFLFLVSSIGFGQTSVKRIDSLIALAKKNNDTDSMSNILSVVLKESKAIGYTNGMASYFLVEGVNLYNQGKFDKALTFTYQGEKLVLSTENNAKIAHMYALRGNCYNNLFFFEKSKECLFKAIRYANEIKDNDTRYFSLGRIYRILATNFNLNPKIKKKDSVLFYHKKSLLIQRKISTTGLNQAGVIIQAGSIGKIFLELGAIDSAKYYFNWGLKEAEKNKLPKYAVELFLGIGNISLKSNQLDSALNYFNKALQLSLKTQNGNNIKLSYEGLAKTYDKLGNEDKANMYFEKYGLIADSLAIANKAASTIPADFILKEKESSFTSSKTRYIIIISCSIILLALSIFVIIRLRTKQKRMLLIHKDRLKVLNNQLANTNKSTQPEKVDEEELKAVIMLAMSNSPTFLMKYKELQPQFFERLMDAAPTLVTTDLLICAQLRLGFYTKEIARYTKTSVRSVESKKYRIRKKLDISPSEDINVWMMNL